MLLRKFIICKTPYESLMFYNAYIVHVWSEVKGGASCKTEGFFCFVKN